MRFSLITSLILLIETTFGQTTNAYIFIEPNVSLSYDSNTIKIQDIFYNNLYHTESYWLTIIPSNANVFIDSKQSPKIPTQKYQDSLIDLSINMVNNIANDTMQIYKEGIAIHYNGFSGFGFITKSKLETEYVIAFRCSKFYDGGVCSIFYSASSKDTIDSYSFHKNDLLSIIDRITTYSVADYKTEDSLLLKKYTISVDSADKPEYLPPHLKGAFFGKVIIEPVLENKVKEVIVLENYGSQIFKPQTDGQIIFYCNDDQIGVVEKNCELVLLDKFGKQVRVPFKFSYVNK